MSAEKPREEKEKLLTLHFEYFSIVAGRGQRPTRRVLTPLARLPPTFRVACIPTTTALPPFTMSTSSQQTSPFSSMEDALAAFGAGEFLVVMDDEDRENEGDLLIAASECTTEKMAWFIKHTRCVRRCCCCWNQRSSSIPSPGASCRALADQLALALASVPAAILLDPTVDTSASRSRRLGWRSSRSR